MTFKYDLNHERAVELIDRCLPENIDTILLGDCNELLRSLPDCSVDLIVSSPPYNIGKEYESRVALQQYIESQSRVLSQCARVLKRSGSIFWQVGSFSYDGAIVPLDVKFFPILEGLGLIPRNRIVWARQHGLHARRKFSCRHETILWFTKSDDYVFELDPIRVPQKYQNKKHYRGDNKGELSCNPDGKNPGDIWMFRNVKHNHEEQTIHPCQFPEDLIARILLSTTREGALVLDPYMGTGTVAVVARDHNRHYIGSEIDPEYHHVAMRRIRGVPDESNCFPNLKTLRSYVKRFGVSAERYRFDVQVGNNASMSSKIYPEEHHLQELEERLLFEESSFAADRRGESRPVDAKLNGTGKATAPAVQFGLFTDQ
ncbi:MAG: DNA-methyltransferase [Capsulimonadaceae bacterium]